MPNAGLQRHERAKKKIEIDQRRRIVAANILAGLTYREIAAALDVSLGTISGDFKAIIKEWRKHYADDADKWLNTQLRRLDVMLNSIWDNVKDGDLQAMDRALKIMERQAKLLGLDKPAGLDLKSGGKPLKIQMIEVVKDYGGPADDNPGDNESI